MVVEVSTLISDGQLLLDENNWLKAIEHYKFACSLHPNVGGLYLGLAVSNYYSKKNFDALVAAQTAIDLNHKGGQSHYWLAMIKIAISREAKADLEVAIERSENPTAFHYFLMGQIFQDVSPRDTRKAEEYFSKVIENPANPDMLAKALCKRSFSLIERGRYLPAQDDISQAQLCSDKYENMYMSTQRYLNAEIKKADSFKRMGVNEYNSAGATETYAEEVTTCKGCGHSFEPNDSDSTFTNSYCSMSCQTKTNCKWCGRTYSSSTSSARKDYLYCSEKCEQEKG